SEPWVASALGRRRHFSPSAREQRGLSPEIQQSCRYTNCSLNISLQPSRDKVVDQARISCSRLDWRTFYPNASNRKFKPSKCKKGLWPYSSLPPWLVLSPCSSLPAAARPCECEAAARGSPPGNKACLRTPRTASPNAGRTNVCARIIVFPYSSCRAKKSRTSSRHLTFGRRIS